MQKVTKVNACYKNHFISKKIYLQWEVAITEVFNRMHKLIKIKIIKNLQVDFDIKMLFS